MKTMVGNYVLAEEQGVATSMGKFYDLPVFGLGGSTDSKLFDLQTAAEATLSLFTAHLNGANLVHDCGFMDAGMQGSLQLIALTNDLIAFIRAATKPVLVNEETLALDLIDELGPEGDYLASDHTFQHYRDPYYSSLADKRQYDDWLEQGGTTLEQRAADQVDEFVSRYQEVPLPEEIKQKLRDIVKREQERIDRK
jgi:trimethylamine--corrinoid protein Co-methyltransferase